MEQGYESVIRLTLNLCCWEFICYSTCLVYLKHFPKWFLVVFSRGDSVLLDGLHVSECGNGVSLLLGEHFLPCPSFLISLLNNDVYKCQALSETVCLWIQTYCIPRSFLYMHSKDFKTGLTHSKTKVFFLIPLSLYIIHLNLIFFTFSLSSSDETTFWRFIWLTGYHMTVTFLTHNGSSCVPEEHASVKWSIHHSTQSASLYISYNTYSICCRPVGLLLL